MHKIQACSRTVNDAQQVNVDLMNIQFELFIKLPNYCSSWLV
jgi:hypothetical protein